MPDSLMYSGVLRKSYLNKKLRPRFLILRSKPPFAFYVIVLIELAKLVLSISSFTVSRIMLLTWAFTLPKSAMNVLNRSW